MDDYRSIEVAIAKRYGVEAESTRKSVGDFFLNNDPAKPVNVKSNNVRKKNYSPNIISGRKLIEWCHVKQNDLYFVFVDYELLKGEINILRDSGLVPYYQLSWDCLSIEAQGWGVIQMYKSLVVNENQTVQGFFRGMKMAYEKYIGKEERKMANIREMIKEF